jgi:hypothetical protein
MDKHRVGSWVEQFSEVARESAEGEEGQETATSPAFRVDLLFV